jgi:hypothetical protein
MVEEKNYLQAFKYLRLRTMSLNTQTDKALRRTARGLKPGQLLFIYKSQSLSR